MGNGIRRARAAALACGALTALAGLVQGTTSAPAAATFTPPPIRHVWLINLENTAYSDNFESVASEQNHYFAETLTRQGATLTQYFGIGHESLDNYIAQVSGQSPTGDTQGDCFQYRDLNPGTDTDSHGQVIGQGCLYPSRVLTLGQQIEALGYSWKGYMEDMGYDTNQDGAVYCGHPPIGGSMNSANPFDGYVQKHNPFLFFRSIIDNDAYCRAHDVPLRPDLVRDLQRVATTPNFNEITPGTFNDGHDANWSEVDLWLRHYVKAIMASPAYRQDGMVIVTFDESSGLGALATEDTSCCGEIPGPNSPDPGISGPGGGRVGAIVLSPFVKPGTVSDTPYNHYSLLRSLEDLFGTKGGDDGLGHLGFAGSYMLAGGSDPTYPGPGAFGPDVYTAAPGGAAGGSAGPATSTDEPAPDGSTAWLSPGPQGNDLRSVSCASATVCVAVGDRGAIVRTSNGSSWSASSSPTGRSLSSVSCATAAVCFAAGNGGTIIGTGDGGSSWSARKSPTTAALTGISCPTSAHCVAVGDGGTIVTTGDGTGWTARASGTKQRLNGVDCPAADRCYAVGENGTIAVSGDGGTTWTTTSTKSRLLAISCSTRDTCQIQTDNANNEWHTTDGGATWPGGGSEQFLGPAAISCVRGQSFCMVAGEQRWSKAFYPDGSSPGTFRFTNAIGDAQGSDWGPLVAQANAGESTRMDQLLGASCPALDTCFAVGLHGAIVRVNPTAPTGSNWSMQRTGRIRELGGVACTPSTTSCFVVGDGATGCWQSCPGTARTPATVLATSDGATWSLQDPGTEIPLNGVACAATTTCVAVGDLGTVVRTGDGKIWTPVPDPAGARGDNTLAGVSCAAATCVAVGGQGTTVASADGGLTWTSRASGTGDFLNAVSCKLPVCVAVGGRGTIVRSGDSGATWTRVGSGTGNVLLGVSCFSASGCVAVGSGGTVLTSADGGSTWTSVAGAAGGEDLYAVNCYSSAACMAAGSNGIVIRSGDGGATWKRKQTGTSRFLTGISCPSANTCYEAGEDGAVLRTRQGKA